MSANITATTGHKIRVFAMFPTDDERTSWNWVNCLTFPLNTLIQLNFSPKPYKWIRYATGVVVGAQGHLSFRLDDPNDVMEYDDDLRLESAVLYYHTTEDEKRRMFPADPDVGRTNVTSSNPTTRRVNFRSDILVRDRACVLTGVEPFLCDAAHLLPHSKGDQYIDTYTRNRSRDTDNDIVSEIDDVRNGILLNKFAHATLGIYIAFLVTPNFAMMTTDVDPTLQPMEKRCTAHNFVPNKSEYFGDPRLASGSPVRMPGTADNRPPGILFDSAYADAVLRHFAPQSMYDALKEWKSTFYPRGITSAAQASHQAIIDGRAADAERKNKQDRSRDERATEHANWWMNQDRGDLFDYRMIMPYILMKPEEVAASWRKAAEERAERERSHLEDKVGGWVREVANACQ